MCKHILQITGIILLTLLLVNCNKNNTDDPADKPDQQKIFLNEKAKAVVNSNNTFGLNLFKTINDSTPSGENIIVSPLSVSVALGMTNNGANGDTKTAMENTLEFEGMSPEEINESYKTLIDALTSVDPQVTMNIPNSIWYRNTFEVLQEFINLNQNYFYAEVTSLNFDDPAAVVTINNWVAESTNDKITNIIDGIDESAVMFLINAVYFNGTWKYEFDEQNTQPETFHLSDGTTIQTEMMKQEGTQQYYFNELFEAVDLFYGSGNFSMVLLLPKEGLTPDDIIGEMNQENWSAWMEGFSDFNIHLAMPKFKLEYEKQLKAALVNMGMGIAFNPYGADFSKINPLHQLYISFVKHKTYIDVNEEGTEAAAVTIVGVGTTSIGGDTPYFLNVNRPFLFAIKERDTQSILFLGKVMEPEYIIE